MRRLLHRFCVQRRKKGNGDGIPASIQSSVPWTESDVSGGKGIYKLVLMQELAGNTAQFLHIKGLQLGSSGVAGDSRWGEAAGHQQ